MSTACVTNAVIWGNTESHLGSYFATLLKKLVVRLQIFCLNGSDIRAEGFWLTFGIEWIAFTRIHDCPPPKSWLLSAFGCVAAFTICAVPRTHCPDVSCSLHGLQHELLSFCAHRGLTAAPITHTQHSGLCPTISQWLQLGYSHSGAGATLVLMYSVCFLFITLEHPFISWKTKYKSPVLLLIAHQDMEAYRYWRWKHSWCSKLFTDWSIMDWYYWEWIPFLFSWAKNIKWVC